MKSGIGTWFLILLPHAFGATLLPPSNSALVTVVIAADGTCPTPGVAPCTANASSNGSLLNVALLAGGGTFSGSGFAESSFTKLKASETSTYSNATSPTFVEFVSIAAFTDIMTVNFEPFTGQAGLLKLDYELGGEFDSSGSFTSSIIVHVNVNGLTQSAAYTTDTTGLHEFPLLFPFVYGTQFNIRANFQVASGIFDFKKTGDFTSPDFFKGELNVIPQYSTAPGSGSVDFSHTFQFAGLAVYDDTGIAVPSATFSTVSGTVYTQVPEPGTARLAWYALVIVGCRVIRKG